MTVTIDRYFMLTKRTFGLAIRDSAIDWHDPALVELGAPETGMSQGDSYPVDGYDGFLCGYNKDHVVTRPSSTSMEFLDVDSVVDLWDPTTASLALYDTLDFGTVNCTGVTIRRTRVLDDGVGADTQWEQYETWLCFHLDGDLPDGTTVTIQNTADAFPDFSATVSFLSTPCEALHCTTYGFAPEEAKLAQLSMWLPGWGNEGVVDFSGVGPAYVIRDDTKEIISRGYIPALRQAYDDYSGTAPGDNHYDVVSTTRYFPITAISKADPMVITATGHDFQVDDVVAVQYATGMNDVNFFSDELLTVTAVSGDDVTIGAVNSTGYGTYTGEGYLYAVIENNFSGTNVYDIAADNFTPPSLNVALRWYIPGLGISPETFKADYALPFQAAKMYFGNYFMNFMNGIAKDGRYGYTAPANFVPGTDGFVMHKISMPLLYSDQFGGPVGEGDVDQAKWATGETYSLPLFGAQDAGDFDTRVQWRRAHETLAMKDRVSDTAWRADLGYPTALSLGVDAAFWAGTESLPDILQGVIVHFEGIRRMREPTGECAGGYNFGDGDFFVGLAPSWLRGQHGYAHAPDVAGTFGFAGYTAELGRQIKLEGLTTLGNTLITLAEESYAKGQEIITDPDTFYADLITIDSAIYAQEETTEGRLSDTTYRDRADIYLYRATGDTAYLTGAEAFGDASTDQFGDEARATAFAHWAIGEDANKTVDFETDIINTGDARLTTMAGHPYPSTAYTGSAEYVKWAPWRFFYDLANAYAVTGEKKYLDGLSKVVNHVTGCNTLNASWTRGIGNRQVRGHLNLDTQNRNMDAPSGTICFGPNPWFHGSINAPFIQGRGNPSNAFAPFFTYRNQVSGFDSNKQPIPPQWSIPMFDFRIEHPRLVSLMEQAPEDANRMFQIYMILWDAYGKGAQSVGTYKRAIGQWAA